MYLTKHILLQPLKLFLCKGKKEALHSEVEVDTSIQIPGFQETWDQIYGIEYMPVETGRVLVERCEKTTPEKHSNTYTYQKVLAYLHLLQHFFETIWSFLSTNISLLTPRTPDQYTDPLLEHSPATTSKQHGIARDLWSGTTGSKHSIFTIYMF